MPQLRKQVRGAAVDGCMMLVDEAVERAIVALCHLVFHYDPNFITLWFLGWVAKKLGAWAWCCYLWPRLRRRWKKR